MSLWSMLSSAGLIAPAGLAALGIVPVIVLLYLLKLRRTEVVIASTLLWRKSLQDLTANAPFQRLRANLLLFLQCLAVALIAAAIARPFLRAPGLFGDSQCLAIDRSASMGTIEADGRTRLDAAKETARGLIDGLRGGDRLMIVSFAEHAEVLCELTSDRRRLREAIERIEPTGERSNIADVMAIARSLAPNNRDLPSVVPGLQVILISDGRLSDLEALGETTLPMNYVRVGAAFDNAGITGFDVRRPAAAGAAAQAFIQVAHYGEEPLEATLTLSLDGAALAVEAVQVAPGSRSDFVFALPAIDTGVLRAEIDREDAFAGDNAAHFVLRPAAYADTVIVGEAESAATQALTHALRLDPRVRLRSMTPADYTPAVVADLVLFDGFAPPSLPARGALVFFNAAPPLPGLAAEGSLASPAPLAPDRTHPAMRFLNPANVHIAEALRLRLPEGARTLLAAQGGAPLIADVGRGGLQILVVAFDPGRSDWPLNLSFPLFVQNLVAWAPRPAAAAPGHASAGTPIEIAPGGAAAQATVTRPGGRVDTVSLDPARPVYYSATEHTGLYAVRIGEAAEVHAVNLLDAGESNIRPAESLAVGRGTVQAETGPLIVNKEVWPWLAAAALAVLAAEWLIYCRRAGW